MTRRFEWGWEWFWCWQSHLLYRRREIRGKSRHKVQKPQKSRVGKKSPREALKPWVSRMNFALRENHLNRKLISRHEVVASATRGNPRKSGRKD